MDMLFPQRALRYPYNEVQNPTMVVRAMPAWEMELTTSSLGAMSPNHQANAGGASIVALLFRYK